MEETLVPIGQFANLTWLSPKALRLYQAQGLLEPALVDPGSGYRYYSPSQIPAARRIGQLRRAGVPLAEIAAFLRAPAAHQIDVWRKELEAEVIDRRRLLDHIARTLDPTEVPEVAIDPTSAALTRAIPVLASLDIEATLRFYAEKMGFVAVAR